ncbi:alpha/beta hydrolase [bacterium]|nr:MAG: alpha/beta hydrolase [bacterium]
MEAMRLARGYPSMVTRLVLENPIGLEDYGQVVPFRTTAERTQSELEQSAESYRAYVTSYYVRKDPGLIEPFVAIRSAISRSPEFPRWAEVAARTTNTILQQPTVYDLPSIACPTLLIIGDADRTAVGKAEAPEALRKTLGNVPELARKAAATLSKGRLTIIPKVGHIPHLESPDAFHKALLPFLAE